MRRFVQDSYFIYVVEATKQLGYELLAKVQISTEDLAYRTPVTAARETRLFFTWPDHALIVQLDFKEVIGRKKDQYYNVGINLYVNLRGPETAGRKEPCLKFDHLWKGDFLCQLDVFEIASRLHRLCKPMIPLLAERFEDLQTADFPPSYTFPNCNELFWRLFPYKRLRRMVEGSLCRVRSPSLFISGGDTHA